MVSGGSVDGLVSGMSTSQVISQLMQAEAAPQTALKKKVTTQQTVVTAYQSINTRMSALLNAAKTLTDASSWKAASAKSSSDAVIATATGDGSAQAGSLTFSVKQLATAHSVFFGGTVTAKTAPVLSGTTIGIAINGSTETVITPADGSLNAVIDAINGATDLGVKASAVQSSPGRYTLQLTSTATGADADFTVSGIDSAALGSSNVITAGADAELLLGTTNPVSVTSNTNTFSGLLGGLTLTATRAQTATETPVTVSVSTDAEGIAGKVQAFVDAANSALSEIATQSKNKSGDVAGGPLAGNFATQQLTGRILDTVSRAGADLGSLKTIGVELTRDGKFKFSKETFLTAFVTDPVKTKSYFTRAVDADNDKVNDGFADRLAGLADAATKSGVGTLSQLIKSGTEKVAELNRRVGDWDARLTIRRTSLQRQFTAMETALGKLKNQSSWLSGQIAAMG